RARPAWVPSREPRAPGPRGRRRTGRGPGRSGSCVRSRPDSYSTAPWSHAVEAELTLGVGQLALALEEEAGLADELVLPLRDDLGGALGALLGKLGGLLLFLLGLFLLGDDESLLQHLVQGGLDVVALFVVVIVLVVLVGDSEADRLLRLEVLVFDERVVVRDVVLDVILEILEVGLFEVLGLFQVGVEELVVQVLVGHAGPSGARAEGQHRREAVARQTTTLRICDAG